MKRLGEIFIVGLFCLLAFPIYAQKPGSEVGFETGKFVDKENKLLIDVVQSNLLNNNTLQPKAPANSNQVFIAQVGFGNQINSRVSSSDARVNLEQKGNDNTIEIDLTADKIRYNFIQHGNNNIFEHTVNDPAATVTIDDVQLGNNNYIQRIGSNSIGESLQVKMTGNSGTVVVRNFN